MVKMNTFIRAAIGALAFALLAGCMTNPTQEKLIDALDRKYVNVVAVPNADCLKELNLAPFPPVKSVSGGDIEGVYVRRAGDRCFVVMIKARSDGGVDVLHCFDRWKTSRPDCERREGKKTGEREYTATLNWANGWARYEVVPSGDILMNAYSYPKYGMSGQNLRYWRVPTPY